MLALGGIGLYLLLGRLFPGPMSTILDGIGTELAVVIQFVVVRLLAGIALVWLYAAARFRLRSTWRTALRVSLAAWFLAYVPLGWLLRFLDVLPLSIVYVVVGWGLVEMLLAGLAGGLVHKLTKPEDTRY